MGDEKKKPLRKTLEALGRIGAGALKSGAVGPGGVLLGNVLGGILGARPDDDDALAAAIEKATPEQVARIMEVNNQIRLKELDVEVADINAKKDQWLADSTSPYWLPNNIRPLTLAYLLVVWTVWMLLSAGVITAAYFLSGSPGARTVDETLSTFFTSLGAGVSTLLGTVVVGYFAVRSHDKRLPPK